MPPPRRPCSTARSATLASCRTLPGQGACISCAASCGLNSGAARRIPRRKLRVNSANSSRMSSPRSRSGGSDRCSAEMRWNRSGRRVSRTVRLGAGYCPRWHDPRAGRARRLVQPGHQPRLRAGAQCLHVLQKQHAAARLGQRGGHPRRRRPAPNNRAICPASSCSPQNTCTKRPGRPRPRRVQRAATRRLAGAGFAVDQHGRVGLREVQDVLAQAHHRGQSPISGRPPSPRWTARCAARGFPAPYRAPRRRAGRWSAIFSGVERLFQEIERTDPHRLDRHGHVAVPGDQDHRQRAVDTHQPLEQRHAVHPRHADIATARRRESPGPTTRNASSRAVEGRGVEPRKRQPLADRLAPRPRSMATEA